MRKQDIAIVGYGTAGQALAVLLSRDGHRVQVFEQAQTPGPVGAGFLLQPSGLQVLWEMGLLAEVVAHGAPIQRLYGDTPCGRAVMDMRYAQLNTHLYGVGTQRGTLFSLLDAAWTQSRQLHVGQRIAEVDAPSGRVQSTDGRWHGPFDLVVACDGSASALRTQLQATRVDRIYPWGALWCLVPCGAWEHVSELRQRYVAARKMIGLLPVGTRPGDGTPRLSFFWSLPREDFEPWQQRGMEVWHEELARLWPQAVDQCAQITDAGQLARASYRDAVIGQWSRGRLVVAGDAAHAMSPQLGQGVNMALLDAQMLRDVLRLPISNEQALALYQQRRKAHVAIYQFWSRWLTPLFQSEHDRWAQVRDVMLKPMAKMPLGAGHMLRVLSGTQRGVLGTLALQPAFVSALAQARAART